MLLDVVGYHSLDVVGFVGYHSSDVVGYHFHASWLGAYMLHAGLAAVQTITQRAATIRTQDLLPWGVPCAMYATDIHVLIWAGEGLTGALDGCPYWVRPVHWSM